MEIRAPGHPAKYSVNVGSDILSQAGVVVRKGLGKTARQTALISNKKVFSLYGEQVISSLEASGFSVPHWLMGDGERFKSFRSVEQALRFFNNVGLDRGDGVIALGGGVVSDLAGFASSIYLRGIPYISIPTTLLAQVDSSVGGKTGVNMTTGKNLVGTFHQPRAVIIDVLTLTTLPDRELSAGLFETIKQGAVASRKLFKQTTDFLRANPKDRCFSADLPELITSHVGFKASIVRGDDQEDIARKDSKSRKILNFGHTVAHALETITDYQRFRHGEAVGHGVMVAGILSKNLGLLEKSELESLIDGVQLCGPLPDATDLDANSIIRAISHDKKRSAGKLQWVLLERIGKPRLVDAKGIDTRLIKRSMSEAFRSARQ